MACLPRLQHVWWNRCTLELTRSYLQLPRNVAEVTVAEMAVVAVVGAMEVVETGVVAVVVLMEAEMAVVERVEEEVEEGVMEGVEREEGGQAGTRVAS